MSVATEFGYNDNPAFGGYTEANWNKGAWGDDISTQDIVGVALPEHVLAQNFGNPDAAHNQLVRVTNNVTGQSTVARIVDKGPSAPGADIDLTYGAARAIGSPYNSTSNVTYEILGKLGTAPGTPPDSSALRTGPLAQSPAPPEEAPPQDTETPIDKVKRAFPETQKWSDGSIVDMLAQQFPGVPKDRLSVYGHQPGGAELIRQYQERGKSPLEKFRDMYPKLASADHNDEKDLQYLHDALAPDEPMIQFKARANPPNPVLNFLGNLYNDLEMATVDLGEVRPMDRHVAAAAARGDVVGAARLLTPSTPAAVNAGLAGIIGTEEEIPKDITDSIANLLKLSGDYGWSKAASDWMTKNVPGYGIANKGFQDFVNHLAGRAKQWEQTAAVYQAAEPKNQPIKNMIGEAIGASPDIALSFGLGSGEAQTVTGAAKLLRNSALFGTLYETVSAYGHAVENQQKNALIHGVDAGGFRLFQEFMFNTGKGRLVSGFLNGLATVADVELEKWANGQPNDLSKDVKHFTVGFIIGHLAGGKEPVKSPLDLEPLSLEDTTRPMEPLRGEPEATSVLSTEGDVFKIGERQVPRDFGPEVGPLTMAQHEARSALMGKRGTEALEELSKTEKKREVKIPDPEAGLKTAPVESTFHFNNHSEPVREELQKAQEAHENGDTDKAAAHIDKAMVFMPDGEKRNLARKVIDSTDELAGEKLKPTPAAATKEKPKTDKDTFYDYHFSGVPFPARAIKDYFNQDVKQTAKKVGKYFSNIGTYIEPERGSEARRVVSQLIRSANVRSEQVVAGLPQAIAQKHGAIDAFQKMQGILYGDKAEVQRRYVNTRSEGQQLKDLIDYQAGKRNKDPLMDYILEKQHDPLMKSILEREHRYGVDTPELFKYVQHNWIRDEEIPALHDALKARGVNPSFIKPQQMDLAVGTALGFRLKTTNIIDIDRARLLMSEYVIKKIKLLQEIEDHGYAWEKDRKDIPDQYRNDKYLQPAQNGKSYYLVPDIVPLWNNAFDPKGVFDPSNPLARAFFEGLHLLKPAAAAKTFFSGFHPLHITQITSSDVISNAAWRVSHGVGNWRDGINAGLGLVPGVSDIYHTVGAARRYNDEVSFLQGKSGMKWGDLDSEQQRNVSDFLDMGGSVLPNRDHQILFSKFIDRNLPIWEKQDPTGMVRMGARVLDLASNGFNRWWFEGVTPRLKFSSMMMRRDTLGLTNPELFKESNRLRLLEEYGKIHRDVEGRYGEMNYQNLFQPRWLKQVGQATLLSYGWQLGLMRVMGDGVIDTATNAAHWNQLVAEAKARGTGLPIDKIFNERLAYTTIYATKMMLAGTAISVLVGGKKPEELTLWDAFYPYVGKDASGHDKRVNMQYFLKEIPSYFHYAELANDDILPAVSPGAATHLLLGKMSPMLQAVGQALYNKDYMGKPIGQLPDRIWYLLQQSYLPISLENAGVAGQSTTDKIMSVLGFSPSGKWTMRTDWENRVLAQSVIHREGGSKHAEARDEYRQAFILKDQGALQDARTKLRSLGVMDKDIKKIEKDANVSTAQKAFKTLDKEQQLDDLRQMSPEERAKWLPHASKAVKHQFNLGSGYKGSDITPVDRESALV